MRWRSLQWLFGFLLFCLSALPAVAQPELGLRLDLVSIRNRQSSPVPVRVRLEYNQPQLLEGTLELSVYDAQDYIEDTDLLATIVRDGIVLSGRDYEFNLLLPPLPVPANQNFAVRAWFVTKDHRIPLTSIRGKLNPPEPFDLIMPKSNQRGLIVCSICDNPTVRNNPPPDREQLENLLTMGDWNGERSSSDAAGALPEGMPAETTSSSTAPREESLVHFAASLDSSEISEDPLWLCGFDVLLMSDGGLQGLTQEQLAGIRTWVRGGGSLCVHAIEPLQSHHLNFLRDLTGFGRGRSGDLALDAGGRLLFVTDEPGQSILVEAGLGRVALLPVSVPVSEQLAGYEQQARLLKHLWRLRSDLEMSDPEKFRRSLVLRKLEAAFQPDTELGWNGSNYTIVKGKGQLSERIKSRFGYRYGMANVTPEQQVIDSRTVDQFLMFTGLQPQTEPVAAQLEEFLLPESLKLVPTSVMLLILFGYILMIGPVDYVVLGHLKARKYTWITFPVVTLIFTLLTMGVARYYMGNQNSIKTLTVTDLGEGGEPLRQSAVSTVFYSGHDMLTLPQRNQLAVQVEETSLNGFGSFDSNPAIGDDAPSYNSAFPSSWSFVQPVRQWSPVTFRSFTLSPDVEKTAIPDFPWDDASLLATVQGRQALTEELRQLTQLTGRPHAALVLNAGRMIAAPGLKSVSNETLDYMETERRFYGRPQSEDAMFEAVLRSIPTQRPVQASLHTTPAGFFNIFSGISPQGSGTLEDLVISDSTDPTEYVLVLIRTAGQNVDVFRRKHRVLE